ncbi:MAG: flagellar export chaperone FliS [Clostridiales bacterium]|jgi:flagellar protein FliS|nr:flagellar export chaperone FliS [Clostridiales bacterium]
MAIPNPYKSYRENSVTTACPEELVVLMYRGLEKYIKQGQIFIKEKNYEKANEALLKAQDIVSELMLSLDMDIEMSGQLYSLYDFVLDCLREANVKKEDAKLKDALVIVTGLKEAWEGALVNIRQIKYGK